MALELVAVTFDAVDAPALGTFWAGLLDRVPTLDSGGVLLAGDETQVGLRFVPTVTPKTVPNHLHLHLTSRSLDDQQVTVGRALELGARNVDVGQFPEERHIVLADHEGNEFCVIEPGNGFLAGCGFLGEVTCEGSRDVGMFWRDALGWPLVWDRGEQTAIQSPRGGTKLSWDAPVPTQTGHNRQRFLLAAEDPVEQAQRLLALGASLREERTDGLDLLDPDGNEFSVRAR